MRTQSVTVTGVAASAPLLLDAYTVGDEDGVFIDIGAGCTATVEITPDDIMDPSVVPVWYPTGVTALTGATTDVAAGLPFAARGIRLNQTVGAALSTLKVVTQGII